MPVSDNAEIFVQLWGLLAPATAPAPEREVLFAKSLGRKWRADFLWQNAKLVVEIDGGQWSPHGGRHNTDKDRHKMNAYALLGYRVLRFSSGMLKDDPAECVAMVVKCLQSPNP